ncbi:CoB--CoM heterodisulfide reductase iron-sulfur subunit A family protein [Candidatus Bathyarchaeota archaeon]|nr:CoB--CoM heterodisulfide reductase iron-sulfur subunit A family protein [Candidatus Bathyarchaeota archaeon]
MEEKPRVGVYVCSCGLNIAGIVNVEEVVEHAKTLPDVVVAKNYVYTCSEPGQAMIREDIKNHKLNRVVVASCSPQMHEPTFRRVVEEEGLNPYLLEMANIREQCSWVHFNQPEKATEKAKDLVRMAVAKARLLYALDKREVGVEAKALVIGGGVTGIQAAIDLANRGFYVYLVEKTPYLGGRVAQLNRVILTNEEALELLSPMLKTLTEHPNIKVFTNSEIENLGGYIGNFEVTLNRKPRYVTAECTACGKCAEVCPVEVSDEFNLGLTKRKAIHMPYREAVPNIFCIDEANCTKCGECLKVCEPKAIVLGNQPKNAKFQVGTIVVATGFDPYMPVDEYCFGQHKTVITQLQLERLLSKNGPTKGHLVLPSTGKVPKSVVFILCVGSRNPDRPYCSRICCTAALKNAMLIKKQFPEIETFVLYRDIRAFGKDQEVYYGEARELGINFLKFSAEDPPQVCRKNEDGQLQILVNDPILGMSVEIPADLTVLVEAMTPRQDTAKLGSTLGISRSPDGFFREAHPKLRPLDTSTDGIYLAGVAQGPKDITESLIQASGAAARAVIPLSKGKIEVEPIIAVTDEKLCSGCGTCVALCPYGAIKKDEKGIARVTEVACKGCGTCAASCPERAITMRHFTDEQIAAQAIAALGKMLA